MVNNIGITHISLILLTLLVCSYLTWLVFKTLKEGRKALEEINNDKL